MIEAILIEYLNEEMSVPAYAQRPEDEDDQYVIVEKTGSTTVNKLTTATIAIQSYAGRLLDAATLNEEVKTVMDGFAALPEISAAKLMTDYNFTSTASKQPRYQAVYQITHY